MLDMIMPFWGQIRLALMAAAAAALFMAGWTINGWRMNAAIADQKVEAAHIEAKAQVEAAQAETASATFVTNSEIQHARTRADIQADLLSDRLSIDRFGGLRVPGRGTCGPGPVPIAAGTAAGADGPAAGCLIDPEIARQLADAKAECRQLLDRSAQAADYAGEVNAIRARMGAVKP